jgi:uncharacterized protein
MRGLLDVSVLIVLFDPDHVFHNRVHSWWAAASNKGWASCPLTENGMIRIMSTRSYSQKTAFTSIDIVSRLQQFVTNTDHEFWPDDISLRNATIFPDNRSYSSHTLTDIYLLGLAVQHAGRLVTMDAHISVACVRGANAQTICVI